MHWQARKITFVYTTHSCKVAVNIHQGTFRLSEIITFKFFGWIFGWIELAAELTIDENGTPKPKESLKEKCH